MVSTLATQKPKSKVYHITQKGLDKLQTELDDLRTTKRADVAQRIHDAIDNEKLSENGERMLAEYEQSWMEGRIHELKKSWCDGSFLVRNTRAT